MKIYQLLFIFIIAILMVIGGAIVKQVIPSGGINNRSSIQEIASMYRNSDIDCVNAASRLLDGLHGEGFNAKIFVGNISSPNADPHQTFVSIVHKDVDTTTRVFVYVEENPDEWVAIEPNSGTIIPVATFTYYDGMIYDTISGINTSSCEVR